MEKLQVDVAGPLRALQRFRRYQRRQAHVAATTSPMAFAIRGTFSTGFRAPTLAEAYYSATNVSPSSANVQLPPNSDAAKLVGIDGLQPEEATNYSLGFVLRPIERLTVTLDAYQIKVDDRIVGSGQLCGTGCTVNSPAVVAAIAANGNVLDPTVTQTGIAIFSNGLDTRTRGADLTLTYPSDYSWGHVDWSLGANYNKTEVTSIKPTPAPLVPQSFYNATAMSEPGDRFAEVSGGAGRRVVDGSLLREPEGNGVRPGLAARQPERRAVLRDEASASRRSPISRLPIRLRRSSSAWARTTCSIAIPTRPTARSWRSTRRPRTRWRWRCIRRSRRSASTAATTMGEWSTASELLHGRAAERDLRRRHTS